MSRRGNIRLVWMRSFSIVITIALLFLLIFFFYVRNSVEKDAIAKNYSKSGFVQNMADQEFSEITLLVSEIFYKLQAREPSKKNNFNSVETYQLVNELKTYSLFNAAIQDIFIYYPKSDRIVGTLGSYKYNSYYFLQNHSLKYCEEWVGNLLNGENQGFFFFTDALTNEPVLYYSRELKWPDRDQIIYKVFIRVNQEAVSELLQKANMQDPHELIVMLKEDKTVFSYAGNKSLLPVVDAIPTPIRFGTTQYVQGFFITCRGSVVPGLYYYTVTDRNQLLTVSKNITRILLVCIISSLAVNILCAFYLSNRNARPISQIIKRIQDTADAPVIDEYSYISQRIESLLQTSANALERLEEQQKLLTASFVASVIHSGTCRESEINALAASYGISLENQCFCVVLSEAENPDEAQEISEEILRLYQESHEFCSIYSGMLRNRQVYILNYDVEDDGRDDVVNSFIQMLSDRLKKDGYLFAAASGNIYLHAGELFHSYTEAVQSLDTAVSAWKSTISYQSRNWPAEDIEDSDGSVAVKARQIIDACYADPSMGLAIISDRLGVSGSYVSRAFKKEYGHGISEYINRLRIGHAKRLMKSTDYSVKDVAREVGFSSDVSFIRVFKKYENITPGKYQAP